MPARTVFVDSRPQLGHTHAQTANSTSRAWSLLQRVRTKPALGECALQQREMRVGFIKREDLEYTRVQSILIEYLMRRLAVMNSINTSDDNLRIKWTLACALGLLSLDLCFNAVFHALTFRILALPLARPFLPASLLTEHDDRLVCQRFNTLLEVSIAVALTRCTADLPVHSVVLD